MRRLITLGLVIAAAALTATGQLVISTNPTLPPAIIGQPYSMDLTAANSGGAALTWSFVESGPPGFTIVSAAVGQINQSGTFCVGSTSCTGGVVSGPAMTYTFGVQVNSQFSQSAFQNFTLVVENPLQIVTKSLPAANASLNYSATLMGAGATGNYVWSLLNDGGALPPGFTLDPVSGVLAGTAPALNGVYSFTVQLVDQVTKEVATQPLSITVINGVPATTIVTTSLPNATVNQQYVFQLIGTGLNPVWSVVPGTPLPPGFSLSSDGGGLLTGISGSTGAFSFQIQLINSLTPTLNATQTYSFFITLGQPLTIVEGNLPPAAQNVPYSTTLTPSLGLPPYTWSLGVGTPPALSISNSGVISGTLATAGSFSVLVSLKDATGTIFTRNYTLVVSNSVSITTTSLPNGALNLPYSATLTAIAGQGADTWNIPPGSLPPGLILTSATGQISGTPTALGSYPFTARVTDSAPIPTTDTKALTITISQPLTISTTLIGASLGQNYSQTLTATGGTQPVISWNLISGSPPTGLLLNSSTGAITGIPSILGPATFAVRATDSAGQTATQSFTLTVANPVTISAADFSTSVGTAVSQTVTAGGGVSPYTFTFVSGAPVGLQLGASTGVISGAAITTGTFPVTLQATDANGRTATASITITVTALPLTIVVPASPGSSQQPGIGVSIPAPSTGDITGTLTLAFVPSATGGTDNMIVFQNGSRSITFTIPKGSTTAPNVTVITGTVAGTITLTASVPGNADVVKTIVIPPTVPVISSVALQQVTGGLNVVVSGYSNTREVSSGSFTFTVSSGNTLSQAAITVPLTSAYAAWFGPTNTATSNATGGLFKLTVPFSVTQGSAAAITKVNVTLTNTQGTSAAVSSP